MYSIGVNFLDKYIQYALVSSNGNIKENNKIEIIDHELNKTLTLLSNNIIELIKRNKVKVEGIGIAIQGKIKNDKLVSSYHYKKWVGINIVKILANKTKLKTYINNKVNAAILTEAKFGAAKGISNVVLLDIGSEVNGGLIINKKIYKGFKEQGTELGHMAIIANGKPCTCGRRGCLEAYISNDALTNQTIAEMNISKRSYMWNIAKFDINNVDDSICWKAEKHNDHYAKKVINQYIFYLSEGILNYCNIFRPELIIISGDIAKQKTNLTSKINKYLQEHQYGFKGASKVKVITNKLGEDCYVIGAACLSFIK